MQLETSPKGMSSSDQGGQRRTTKITAEVPTPMQGAKSLAWLPNEKDQRHFPSFT